MEQREKGECGRSAPRLRDVSEYGGLKAFLRTLFLL